jgi:hypothetical protein
MIAATVSATTDTISSRGYIIWPAIATNVSATSAILG